MSQIMDPAEARQLERAIALAADAHAGQRRMFTFDPYIVHPLRVMLALADRRPVIMIAAVLHDTVEDTALTLTGIAREFGDEVALLVDSVTHRPGESYSTFIQRVADSGEEATLIKIEDITDNLNNLEPGSLRDRYEKALTFLSLQATA